MNSKTSIMARQKGIIKLEGTIGDINFYMVKGKAYARKAGGGFNGNAIKTKESMLRVRENGSEFGHCSRAKKEILRSFHPYFTKRERGFHGKCMKLFLTLKDLDTTSKRGQRRVDFGLQTVEGKRLLRDFPFGKPIGFLDAMASQWNFDESGQRLDLPSFLGSDYRNLPLMTDLKFSLFLVDFNFEAMEFQKYLLDEKSFIVQEVNPAQSLFPASPISVVHTPIFYVGLEIVSGMEDSDRQVGFRVV